jgi:hypothetical protein
MMDQLGTDSFSRHIGPASLLVSLLAAGWAALPAVAPVAAASLPAPAASTAVAAATLSNLRTLSRWAYPQAAALVHRLPSSDSGVVGHLSFLTGDGQAEVYIVLRSFKAAGTSWIEVPLPGRPNGVRGWVPAAALGELHPTRDYLRVNRTTLRATLFRGGRSIWRAPVGVGRASLPTPAGHFYITEKLLPAAGSAYGPSALGTSAYAPTLGEWPGGGVVGIHGTDEPQLIPGHPSHGCIRLRNPDVERLAQLIQVGTPIEIV